MTKCILSLNGPTTPLARLNLQSRELGFLETMVIFVKPGVIRERGPVQRSRYAI